MIQYEGRTFLTMREAADIMGKPTDTLRQMIYRGNLSADHKIEGRIYFDPVKVRSYYPKKRNLPAFEDLEPEQLQGEVFLAFDEVRGIIGYSRSHLINMIRKGRLVAYCTADDQILIAKSSLDALMGVNSDAASL